MGGRDAITRRYRVEGAGAAAPCFDGHFPGAPIMPGAVLLAHAARLLRAEGVVVRGVRRMKFLQPLAPETPFEIEITRLDDMADLRWICAGGLLAKARLRIA